ncbi:MULTISPECIES: Uma2 family endonuclease [unclassified Nodularia (in: cyanobacteria)]|uniref:Uma2 family endonuclease n=1 Tax=unclassified Nodularia (in: cyanobacteria) TaxID=2656917 RepID=UPI00187F7928|nr:MULTISPECIES: Uma2 family endonuclease [unclassified Nodularia (in: cyanobacteria)]MBE9201639.1 Uma2 family endonuclease [Nodularia sp. LEGE 06071]MCC2691893.1 Uma2 family endonuclease [Nodularia sp. LEGE 04288]
MVEQVLINADNFYVPDANLLVTEDDTPVDNFASEKQQRLLVGSLYSSLQNQIFLAAANVGVYYAYRKPPIVPDVLFSLDVQIPEKWWDKQNRCYMLWEFEKPPEVVMEIVSNKEGDELGKKLEIYEQMRASYYIVYDPNQQLGEQALRIYELRGRRYFETSETWLEQVGLGLILWSGAFEGRQDNWLRWCYQDGTILPTGDERAEQEKQRAEQEKQRAEQERQRAEEAEQRAQLLAERLRAMGIDPDTL